MKRYRLGLLRDSDAPSLSPAIFDWAFRRAGVDGEYRLYNVAAGDVPVFLAASDWDGLNVTIPHKTLVYSLCDETTARAERAGAVNTLYHGARGLAGDNTDVGGFLYALSRALPPELNVERALVIGTGGAARAALVALSEMLLAPPIAIATRDIEGARMRLNELGQAFASVEFISLTDAGARLSEFPLVVQATPVGGSRAPEALPLPGRLEFARGALAFELNYRPAQTAFLRLAEAQGAHAENGLVMLIAQAAESFELWTGTPFPLAEAMQELLPQLRTL